VKVNNRKVLDGVMDAANIASDKRLTVLRAIDKADKFSLHEVKKLLGAGRKDESGDFTKGAGLDERQSEIVLSLLNTDDTSSVQIAQLNDMARPVRRAQSDSRIRHGGGLQRRPHPYRPLRRARPGILHRPVYEIELLLERKTRKAGPFASARSAAVDATTGSSRAFAASRCRRPDSPSVVSRLAPLSRL